MQPKTVKVVKPDATSFVLGQTYFTKSVGAAARRPGRLLPRPHEVQADRGARPGKGRRSQEPPAASRCATRAPRLVAGAGRWGLTRKPSGRQKEARVEGSSA